MKYDTKEKSYEKRNKRYLKFMLIGTVIILNIFILGINFIDSNFIANNFILNDLNGINIILGIISIPCCFLYYYMYKNNEFFILNISYISIFIEYILINFISEGLITFPFIFRILLLTIAIHNNSKYAKFLVDKKKFCIILSILINLLGTYFELKLREIYTIEGEIFQVALVVYYFILLILLAKRAIKKSECIYTIFVASISVFTIRRIFYLKIFSLYSYKVSEYNKLITVTAYFILLVGLYIEVVRKIQESIVLNNEVSNNEKIISNISESVKDLILTTDKEGQVLYVNKIVLSKLGYEKEDIIGHNYSKIIYEENILNNNLEANTILLEQKWKCKTGKVFQTESIITSVNNSEGETIERVIVARDYSYREQLENLKKKYKEIKEVEKAKGQFFANLSHEIKTPINIIYSCMQLLEINKENSDEALSIAYKKYDKTIKQNCYRLLRLVNNLVDITKIDSGYMTLSFVNYEIISLVEDITMSIVPYVESKNINVIFDTYIEELEIKCDPESIERVILNILSNAIKFTDDGGNIFVLMDADEEYLTIRIKDDGVGVAKELKDDIFERFVQEDKSFNRKNEGSGRGLALVKSLIELHEGMVYLENNTEKGSEFVVKLPNVKVAESEGNSRIIDVDNKPLVQKIDIEFSDIYELY